MTGLRISTSSDCFEHSFSNILPNSDLNCNQPDAKFYPKLSPMYDSINIIQFLCKIIEQQFNYSSSTLTSLFFRSPLKLYFFVSHWEISKAPAEYEFNENLFLSHSCSYEYSPSVWCKSFIHAFVWILDIEGKLLDGSRGRKSHFYASRLLSEDEWLE